MTINITNNILLSSVFTKFIDVFAMYSNLNFREIKSEAIEKRRKNIQGNWHDVGHIS